MTAKVRDVLISLVRAAKDDATWQLKAAQNPNDYAARTVEHLKKLLEVYQECEEELRRK